MSIVHKFTKLKQVRPENLKTYKTLKPETEVSQTTDIHKTLGILLYLTFIHVSLPAMAEFKLV